MSAIDPTISIEVISGSHLAYQGRFVVPNEKGDLSEIVETLPLADDAPQTGKGSIEEFLLKRWAGYAEEAAAKVAPVHLGFKVLVADITKEVEVTDTEDVVK